MKRRFAAAAAFASILAGLLSGVRAEEAQAGIPPNMTVYYFGILVRGAKWSPEETPERAKIQEGHLAHIREMAKAGKLVLAGPLLDDTDWRGVLIYRVPSLEDAQKLADDDPAVKAGRLKVTMHPWLVEKGVLPDPLEKDSKRGID